MTSRRNFLLKSIPLTLLAAGCAGSFSNGPRNNFAPNSVAVLGVVQKQGLEVPISEYRLANDLEKLLRDNHSYTVMPLVEARNQMGAERHEILLKRVAGNGSLDREDTRMLRQMNFPVGTGVILALIGNEQEKLEPERLALRDNSGKVLTDREHVVLSTLRSVSLTATLVDLATERVQMHNEFNYESIERKRYVQYSSGASFGSTVAARLANTVTNGLSKPDWPEAPGLYDSFYELLTDVAAELPVS